MVRSSAASRTHEEALHELCAAPPADIFRRAMEGELRSSPVRSVAWRYFLAQLPPGSVAERLEALAEQIATVRAEYALLLEKHCVDPRTATQALPPDLSNPLSQHEASPWQSFFDSTELREQIERDIERVHPGNDFFATERVQGAMRRILLVWAQENPSISYRQGMHELLAPIVHALATECDEVAAAARRDGSTRPSDVAGTAAAAADPISVAAFISPEHFEADAYFAFQRLMLQASSWYETPSKPAQSARVLSPLLRACVHIQETLLPRVDANLYARLRALEVEPQLYLLRWLRCLFCREVRLEHVKVIWDAILAHGQRLELASYVAIALLQRLRQPLHSPDPSQALQALLHLPPTEKPHAVIERALMLYRSLSPHLQSPRVAPTPAAAPAAAAPAAAPAAPAHVAAPSAAAALAASSMPPAECTHALGSRDEGTQTEGMQIVGPAGAPPAAVPSRRLPRGMHVLAADFAGAYREAEAEQARRRAASGRDAGSSVPCDQLAHLMDSALCRLVDELPTPLTDVALRALAELRAVRGILVEAHEASLAVAPSATTSEWERRLASSKGATAAHGGDDRVQAYVVHRGGDEDQPAADEPESDHEI